ncbi:MAG TPA: type II toxin-antitoxin system VapC family toxin [Gemmataceae bacterium]|nr:type II toxin-antitoxin system VapC family toxin [Gemmataceae bacterium]
MILLDTDHLSVLTDSRVAGNAALVQRLKLAAEPLAIPIVAVEEQCKGWLAKIAHTRDIHQQILPYQHLAVLFNFLAEWNITSLSEAAADLFSQLRRQKIRIGSQDLKIAAIALTENALLLSANLRDFHKVPGLRVENWLPG